MVIKKWGVVSTEILSRELGIPSSISKKVLEYLKKKGHLVEEPCARACAKCPLSNMCTGSVKVYRLAED